MIDQNARILAVETSSRWGSAALGDWNGVIASGDLPEPMSHAREFVRLVHDLLEQREWSASSLTHVFVSIGPGSFTGLRIGVTLARTLGWSLGTRIVAVPTLDALALHALQLDPPPPHVAVMLDAKRGQVYGAAYELLPDGPRRIAGPVLEKPADFLSTLPRPLGVLGEGVTYHRAALDAADVLLLEPALSRPQATSVLRLGSQLAREGQFAPFTELLPLYIRRPEAEEKWEKLHPTTGQ